VKKYEVTFDRQTRKQVTVTAPNAQLAMDAVIADWGSGVIGEASVQVRILECREVGDGE